jgi:PAS domain S-box-containing protein
VRGAIAATVLVIGLVVVELILPRFLSLVVDVATVTALAMLLVFCEFARRGVLATRAELARSEESFRLAQEGALMGTWDVDVATGATTWSDGLRMLYGVGPDYPAGFRHFVPLLHPDDRQRITRQVMEAYASGSDFELECRIVLPSGETRWTLTRSIFIRGKTGNVLRLLGVALDVTKRRLAQAELIRSEETLRLAQEGTGLGAWDWDIETDQVHRTAALYAIFGLDPPATEPTYSAMDTYVHHEDRDALEAEVRRVLASGASTFEYAFRVTRPDGDVRFLSSRAFVVRGATGAPERMVGVTLDETDRKRGEAEHTKLESRLRQAEKLEAVGQLAGGVAHDFNNLLVAIRGYGELALDRLVRGESGVAHEIEGILAAADSGAGLTRQLLAFGRRQVLSPEVLDLNEVVRETESLLTRLIGDGVQVVTTLARVPVVVKADRSQLEQVITNLALNGREAMPAGGRLTITVATALLEFGGSDSLQAVLSVADEGSGIDAVTATRIFEPFFTTKGDLGTGLGLATVHGIVAQSGGHLVLQTVPDHGSTFSVYLPLCAEEPVVTRNTPPATASRGSETILLVEDDPMVRSIVSRMLKARGYTIEGAASGQEAIRRFEARTQPIPLVLSDLIMAGLDGKETIGRIREIEPGTKALYMSGYSRDVTIRSGPIESGTGFIQKPFSGDELSISIRDLLD